MYTGEMRVCASSAGLLQITVCFFPSATLYNLYIVFFLSVLHSLRTIWTRDFMFPGKGALC